MVIRKMNENDIPGLAVLYRQFWNEESIPDNMMKLFTAIENNRDYIILNAQEDGHIIGSIQGIICYELYGACRPFMLVENLIVDSSWRRKGIGRALFAEIEKYAVRNNCSQVMAVTENTRPDALHFYDSIGLNPDAYRGFKRTLNRSV